MLGIIFATAAVVCAFFSFKLEAIKKPFKLPLQMLFFACAPLFLVSGFGTALQAANHSISTDTIYLPLSGGNMTGNISMENNTVKDFYGFPLPNYDSDWVAFSKGEFKTLTHTLGGDINNYFVDIMANDSSDGGTGLNNVYHGLNKEGITNLRRGFYWFNLNTTSVTVYRGTDDARAPYIKVRIWKIFRNDDDAKVIFGSGNSSDPLPDERTYLFAHTNITMDIASTGVWHNISFDRNEDVHRGVTHINTDNTNDTFTIENNGTYELHGHLSFQDSATNPISNIVFRFINNNVEIHGSVREMDLDKKDWDTLGSTTVYAELIRDDEIKFQFTSDQTTVSLESDDTYGDHTDTAAIKISRIA